VVVEPHEGLKDIEDGQIVAAPRPHEAWPSSEGSISRCNRPIKKVSDGKACYPSHPMYAPYLDPASDNDEDEDEDIDSYESETECPSDTSTYGNSTDSEDACESELETCSESPSSHFSYDMICTLETPGFRGHAGGLDKGKRKATFQGDRASKSSDGQQGSSRRSAQKRAKKCHSIDPSDNNEDDDDDPGDDGDDDDRDDDNIRLACPYYKQNPRMYFKCAIRKPFTNLSRVKYVFQMFSGRFPGVSR
jgi:hypothetical protein